MKTDPPLAERLFSQRARDVRAIFPRQVSIPTQGMITLSTGTPDFPTPPHIVEAGAQALRDGHTRYTAWAGVPELRRAIAEKLRRDNGLNYDPDGEILVTTGTQEALFFLMQALLDPGDEILVASPFYDEYRRDVLLAGGRLVAVPTREETAFELDPDELAGRITSKTKAVILISPSNPTGSMQTLPKLEAVARLAQAHNLLVISDELYEAFVYGDHRHHSIGALPGMQARTVTINGFSKHYGMTGWRVGYVAAPADVTEMLMPIKHGMTICAPAVSQWAALAALTGPQEWFGEILAEYDRRRRFWMERLDAIGLTYGEPRGAYYILFNVSSTGLEADEFARRAQQEHGLVLLSLGNIGPEGRDYVRGSLAVPMNELTEGLSRMEEAVAGFRRSR